jgi:hypothetical protein
MPKQQVLLVLVLSLCGASVSAQTWDAGQQEIWRFEEEQWRMSAAKDLSWIETMVHPNASVWGNTWPGPQSKKSLARWNKYEAADSTTLEQEIFPISATITGNVAVAHYRYRVVREDTKKERVVVTGRYTDVLVKEGGKWLFITWAGGDDPKSEP